MTIVVNKHPDKLDFYHRNFEGCCNQYLASDKLRVNLLRNFASSLTLGELSPIKTADMQITFYLTINISHRFLMSKYEEEVVKIEFPETI